MAPGKPVFLMCMSFLGLVTCQAYDDVRTTKVWSAYGDQLDSSINELGTQETGAKAETLNCRSLQRRQIT